TSGALFSNAGGTGTATLATGPSCPWSVQTSASWLTITSSPSGVGPANIQFAVAPASQYQLAVLNIAGNKLTITQTGAGTTGSPVLSVYPIGLNFGSATVLKSGFSQTIGVANSSAQAIPTGSITVSGLNPGSFPYWTDCGASVAPGTSCSINVTF